MFRLLSARVTAAVALVACSIAVHAAPVKQTQAAAAFALKTAATAQQSSSVPKIMLVCSGIVTVNDDPPGYEGQLREGVYLEFIGQEATLYNMWSLAAPMPDAAKLTIISFNSGIVTFSHGDIYHKRLSGRINRISGEIFLFDDMGSRTSIFKGRCKQSSKKIF